MDWRSSLPRVEYYNPYDPRQRNRQNPAAVVPYQLWSHPSQMNVLAGASNDFMSGLVLGGLLVLVIPWLLSELNK